MGFSANANGQTAHEAFLNRQDSELRLLETMKKCLQLKVKCDREYATGILGAVSQGQKIEGDDDLLGSGITQAWKSMMEGFEFAAKLIRQNADSIENKVLTKLNELFVDKRKVKKFYQDEHNRVSQLFSKGLVKYLRMDSHKFNVNYLLLGMMKRALLRSLREWKVFISDELVDDVSRKKVEYQKNLEIYKSMRSRLEEYYLKGGRAGKKLDEARTKYQRACKKLHQTHNEYVLLLTEAVEFEKDYRTILFPGLIESHQGTQENLVQNWKNTLEDAAKFSSLCTEQFRDLEGRVIKIIEGIRPNQEYIAFGEKSRNPQSNISFTFDETLILDTPEKLIPNQLAVDNLTIDWLKSKLNELDVKIKNEQERMLELGESILTNGKAHDTLGKLSPSPELTRKRRELIEMRCDERKLVRQFDLIKFALNDIGCEELPSGCDISIETAFTLTPDSEGDGLDKKSEDLEEDISKSRSSSSQGLHKRSLSSHFNTLMNQLRWKSIPSTPVLSHKEGQTLERSGKSMDKEEEPGVCQLSDDNTDIISFSRVRCDTNKLYLWYGMSKSSVSNHTKNLMDEEWFHGVLPREEVVRLLTREGDFLVRETTRNDECQTVLSVAWGGHKHFIVQTTPEGHYRFEGPAFPTVQELILHQYQSGLPVTSRSGAVLRKPILRERWELNNDDVLLLDKIGRGNFGDVYKARLKSTKQDVAVKTCRVALPDEQKRKFLQEGRILKQYDHPNIVKLIGICVQKQPIMIVMELVPGGSLLTFLRNKADSLVQSQLLRMCRDAAAGMQYLESRNCIHRDLAARNCLIGNEDMVKISDFGMSREEEEYVVSDGMKQIPIKWTAPEALNFGKYTSLCDVWSYGVLAWEIFARGGVPYPGLSNSKAREKIDSGYRMPAPEGTPEEMYKLMLRCWEYQPESRPHFDEIHSVVDGLCSTIES